MREMRRLVLLMTAACGVMPAVVLASGEGNGSVDPVQVDLWQSVYTIVIFIVLLVLLSKFAFKPILAGLQQREKFIRDSLESARVDREAAAARLKDYEDKLTQARQEATALVEEGRRDAEVTKRRIESEARQNAEALVDRAKREINVARDTALRELHEWTAELAMTMASEVLKRQLSPEDHERMVKDALTQLRRSGPSGDN